MSLISFKRHQFPAGVIREAVSLYCRLSLSIRDVEALLANRPLSSGRAVRSDRRVGEGRLWPGDVVGAQGKVVGGVNLTIPFSLLNCGVIAATERRRRRVIELPTGRSMFGRRP